MFVLFSQTTGQSHIGIIRYLCRQSSDNLQWVKGPGLEREQLPGQQLYGTRRMQQRSVRFLVDRMLDVELFRLQRTSIRC